MEYATGPSLAEALNPIMTVIAKCGNVRSVSGNGPVKSGRLVGSGS